MQSSDRGFLEALGALAQALSEVASPSMVIGGLGTPIEVALAWLPFEEEALDRATSVDFGGVKIQAAQPEDLVILKAVAWRDRDRDDVERLLLLHGQQMDLHRVRDLVRQFAAVLEEPERAQQFEQLLQRVGLVHSDPDKK